MFGKKKPAEGLSPIESQVNIIANQIEQLGPGQSLSYKLPEIFGGDLVVIELNPRYPAEKRQRKYILSTDEIVKGKPAGKKSFLFSLDDPRVLARRVVERGGKLFKIASTSEYSLQEQKGVKSND